jgi:threonylcarbamoyladenosine tRNA methylthiotransferase MtaB
MKYSIITFGCRVNQADSLGFEEALRERGAVAAESSEQAELVIINTCSVTASADQGARQAARRLARTNPNAQIVVTGCYATRQPNEFRLLPNVLRVVPNDEKSRLVPLVSSDLGLTTAFRFADGEGSCGALIEPGIAGRTAFTLSVQTGCAQPCSYCIIPTTRGRPRSVELHQVLASVGRVVAAGFQEIALSGVHLGSYGTDLNPALSLFELLRALDSFDPQNSTRSELLFRISSLEPMDCTPEIVNLVADSGRFAPHFHLPLQHASDRILASMRRPYTIEDYRRLVNRIRARMPGASIGSDVIVGFPGESQDDFAELCSYLESSPLTHLHVFPYSDRPGTAAAAMSGRIHGAVIRDRAARVREIGRRLTLGFRESQVGTIHRGLTLEDGSLVVTGNYLKVRIPPGRPRNDWVTVLVTEAGETMRGEIR